MENRFSRSTWSTPVKPHKKQKSAPHTFIENGRKIVEEMSLAAQD